MIPHAGITLDRSKDLKSWPFSSLLAFSRFSGFTVVFGGHAAPLAIEPSSCDANLGYKWGNEMSKAENTPSDFRIHQHFLRLPTRALLIKRLHPSANSAEMKWEMLVTDSSFPANMQRLRNLQDNVDGARNAAREIIRFLAGDD